MRKLQNLTSLKCAVGRQSAELLNISFAAGYRVASGVLAAEAAQYCKCCVLDCASFKFDILLGSWGTTNR